MRLAVVFPEELREHHLYKDPGCITHGLAELGHDVTLVCHVSHVRRPQFPIQTGNSKDFLSPRFWSEMHLEAAVVYTWIRGHGEVIEALKRAGVFTISKGDTDGQVGIRVHPHAEFVLMVAPQLSMAKKVSEAARWVRRYLFSYEESARTIELLSNASVTVVETEAAKDNLIRFLDHYGVGHLHTKLCVIPNPVSEDILTTDIPAHKINQIVCIGRWDDPQKDAPLLARVLERYAKRRPNAEITIIGDGGEGWFEPLTRRYPGIRCLGAVQHEQIRDHLVRAQVCLFTSRWESFHISGHEALAMGCSLVGPNLPFLRSICTAGRFGSMATGRRPGQIAAALEREMEAWEQGERSAEEISKFWRPLLSSRQIAKQYVALMEDQSRR
jgi:glycosyltransferase involved in cell wall biosynthesis